MSEKVTSILDIPVEKYAMSSDSNRDEHGLLDTVGLRNLLKDAGFELANPDSPFVTYFEGAKSGADLSQRMLDINLPVGLREQIKKSDLNAEKLRKERVEMYYKLNSVINESRERVFDRLKDAVLQTNLMEIDKDLGRPGFIANLFEHIAEGKALPENVRSALSEYAEFSWYLVLINSRFIRLLSSGVTDKLRTAGLTVSEEDGLQEGLLVAYRLAAIYDPAKSAYTTWLKNESGGLYQYLLTASLRGEPVGVNTVYTLNKLQTELDAFEPELIDSLSEKDKVLLEFMLYQRNQGTMRFKNADAGPALAKFKTMLTDRLYHNDENTLQVKEPFDSMPSMQSLVAEFERKYVLARKLLNAESWESLSADIHFSDDMRPIEDQVARPMYGDASFKRAFAGLSPRERQIIEMRYGLVDGKEHTLAEIGFRFGVTAARMDQILENARGKLRKDLFLKEYTEN